MPSLKNLLEELKVRRVRNTMAIYVSSALTSVGAVKLFTEAYDLPQVLFPIGVTILTCGLASAFAFAWYHGKEGGQKFQKKEIAIHSLVLIVALVGSLRVGGAAKPASLWADAQSIAVLPFKNMSDSKEDEFFSDGITEDILTQLCKIGDLRVISRTSIMKYKDTEKTIPEIAQELGVGTVLEGSVRRSGNRMRITGQLIKARTDEHVWAETDDREMKDIFATQMDVAQRIAESLRATLSPDERRRIEKPATMNIEAYALYLKGREYYNRYTVEDNERAIELFKKAIALDSSYALAYAGLGDAYGQRVVRHGMDKVSADSAMDLSKKAVSLDNGLAEGYKALGLAAEAKAHRHEALEYYYKAVTLNPNYAPVVANIGWVHSSLGNFGEGLIWMKRSVSLNPAAAQRYMYVAEMYNGLGDDSSAIAWYQKALNLQPDLVAAHVNVSYIYMVQGNHAEAQNHVDRSIVLDSNNVRALEAAGYLQLFFGDLKRAQEYFQKSVAASSLSDGPGVQLAYTLMRLGKRKEAKQILDSTHKTYVGAVEIGDEMTSNPMYAAYRCSLQNDTTTSLRWIRRAVGMGYGDYRWALREPLLENVRHTKDFHMLMDEIKANVDMMRQHARALEAQQANS